MAARRPGSAIQCADKVFTGVCAWQVCREPAETERAENIEITGASHCGLGHHPAVVYAIADRLAQPEGQWKKFDRSGWRALVYPDPDRRV